MQTRRTAHITQQLKNPLESNQQKERAKYGTECQCQPTKFKVVKRGRNNKMNPVLLRGNLHYLCMRQV
jgi:hypothetical protein